MFAPARKYCVVVFAALLLSQPVFAQEKDSKPADKAKAEAKDSDKEKAGSSKKKKAAKVEKKKLPQLRQINLSGNYVDLVQPISFDPTALLIGGGTIKQRSFYRLCKFLDDLQENKRVGYVLFDLSDSMLVMNSAQLDELHRYMKKLRESGKKTYAWLENASNVHLSLIHI